MITWIKIKDYDLAERKEREILVNPDNIRYLYARLRPKNAIITQNYYDVFGLRDSNIAVTMTERGFSELEKALSVRIPADMPN